MTGSQGVSGAGGGYSPEAEYDPSGVNVGLEAPIAGALFEAEVPTLINTSTQGVNRCRNNSVEFDCVWLAMALRNGVVGVEDPRMPVDGGRPGRLLPMELDILGGGRVWVEDNGRRLKPIKSKPDDEVVKVNHEMNGLGHWENISTFFSIPDSQKPTPLSQGEIDHYREDIKGLLNNETCNKVVKAILEKLDANTKIKPYSTNLMDIFNKIKTFQYKAGAYLATVGGNAAMVDAGLIKGGLTLNINYHSLDFEFSRVWSGQTLIHEIIHAAPGSGTNSYMHYQMDQAAWDVAKDMNLTRLGLSSIGARPVFTPTRQNGDTIASPIFNNMISHFCNVRVKR